MPMEEAGATQTRRKRRWVGAAKASKPGQKKGRPVFKPGDREWTPLGMGSTVARKAVNKREAQRAEAEWLAHHFQLTGTSLGVDENSMSLSTKKRQDRQDALTAFPRIPDHDLQELQRIIGAYGLPIAALDSDTAAFVLRRVMLDYFKLNILRRSIKPGYFTPEELTELLHVMGITPAELGHITKAENPHGGLTNILRWLNGASMPHGLHAMRVNRLIEQHVRRAPSGGNPGQQTRRPSTKPETIQREARRKRAKNRLDVPLASAAKAQRENDA